MKGAEAEYIENRQDYMEIQAICELALHSSNPTASSIALQSLGSLHNRPGLMVEFPEDLWEPLECQFKGCFQEIGLLKFKMVVNQSICERLARSYLLKNFYLPGPNTLNISSLNLYQMPYHAKYQMEALLATNPMKPEFAALQKICEEAYNEYGEAVKGFILRDSIENRIEISDVHKWVLSQFETAVMTDLNLDKNDISNICLHLIGNLSPDKTPSFQETMMIRYLSAQFALSMRWAAPTASHFRIHTPSILS